MEISRFNSIQIFLSVLVSASPSLVIAESSSSVYRMSESQLLADAEMVANETAKNLPRNVDSTTISTSALFVKQTKTFIYQYRTTVPLDSQKMLSYVAQHTCSGKHRRAYMDRGIVIRHEYLTPTGLVAFNITARDCK